MVNDAEKKLTKPEIVVLVFGFVALVILILIFRRPPFYDEDEYLQNVALLHQYGFTKAYLLKLSGSAGPLYSIVHYLLEPLTQLQAPAIRFVNIAFLSGTVFFISRTQQLLGFSYWAYSLSIMAIPMTYVISGLALTEIPAMFFLSAGIYLIIKVTSSNQLSLQSAITLSAAGLCIGLAILGRQPYLLMVAAIPVLFLQHLKHSKSLILLLLTLLFSLALPGYVFFLWKGLIAPSELVYYTDVGFKGFLYRPEFFFLCLGYFSVIMAIIAPGFYIMKGVRELIFLILSYLVLAVINYQFELIMILPLESVMEKLLPKGLVHLAKSLSGSGIALSGLYFIVCLIRQLHSASYQKYLLFYSFALMLVALSCIKITWGFSSRYPAQAIPFLIPIGSYFYRSHKRNVLRYGAGVVIGLMSFISYLLK